MPNSDGYIVGYILQMGNTLVKQHITSQNLNYNLETCKEVNTTKFLNQKMKKHNFGETYGRGQVLQNWETYLIRKREEERDEGKLGIALEWLQGQ